MSNDDQHVDEADKSVPEPNFPQQNDVPLAENVEPTHQPVPLNPVPAPEHQPFPVRPEVGDDPTKHVPSENDNPDGETY